MRSLRSKSARGRPCKSPKFQGFHQPNPRKPIFRSAALYHLFDSFRERKSGQIYNLGKGFSEILEIPSQIITISRARQNQNEIKSATFPLVSSCFTKTLWIISFLPSQTFLTLNWRWPFWHGLYPTSCRYFWWYLPPTWQAGPVNQKCDIFFRRIPTFFLGGETLPKYLGEKFLSIPLTDWKLSKRNRPKLRSNPFKSNSQAAKQFTELQDASLQKKLQNGFLQRCGCPFFFPVFQNILGFLVVGDTASLRLLAAGPTTRDQKGLYLSTRGGLTSSKILPTLKLPQERLEYATARTKKLC